MPDIIGYQIFDSLDRPTSALEPVKSDLYRELHDLQMEAEAEESGISYAIGAVLDDGDITFDRD